MAGNSGFGDESKMSAARELQELFGKPDGTKRASRTRKGGGAVGGGQGRRRGGFGTNATPFTSNPQFARPLGTKWENNTRPSTGLAPPPSQRHYNGLQSFSVNNNKKPAEKPALIGVSGLNFLCRQDTPKELAMVVATKENHITTPSIKSNKSMPNPIINSRQASTKTVISSESLPISPAVDKTRFVPRHTSPKLGISTLDSDVTQNMTPVGRPSETLGYPSPPAEIPASEEKPAGNILDTFYALIKQRATIGEEIEELTTRLPIAMDLDGPGVGSFPNTSSEGSIGSTTVKCICESVPQSMSQSSTDIIATHIPGHLPSANLVQEKKCKPCSSQRAQTSNGSGVGSLRPDASAFQPVLREDDTNKHAQDAIDGGAKAAAIKPTKGLSASRWAR